MIIKEERLHYQKGLVGKNIFMFTSNSTLNKRGSLVMGAGCAATVRDTYNGIDELFGQEIEHLSQFNISFIKWKGQWLGAFQTKLNWREPSPISLVKNSINKLERVSEARPNWVFHLPCPAVNHGGRSVEQILPLLEKLPDNVIIYLDK